MSEAVDMLPDPELTMEVGVAEVAKWADLPADQRPCLLDCREPDELQICKIDGCVHLPLGSFPQALEALKALSERGIVVYCHHGMRSMHATVFLRSNGVEASFSMGGGIELWSRQIDPAVPRY